METRFVPQPARIKSPSADTCSATLLSLPKAVVTQAQHHQLSSSTAQNAIAVASNNANTMYMSAVQIAELLIVVIILLSLPKLVTS